MLSQHFDLDRFLSGHPLCITEQGLEELKLHVMARLAMFDSQPSEALNAIAIESLERRRGEAAKNRGRAVGVIQIRGTISQHARGDVSSSLAGGTATETVAEQLRDLLADEEVGRIVLDIDSPGGSSYGVTELANEIYKSRGQKPIVAVANSLAASAAYWIGSQADYFYVTPGGMVGSIGAYAIHQDISKAMDTLGVKTTLIKAGKYKALGNEFEPLDDEARSHIQERVDAVYDQFVHDVARGRGVSEATVRSGYGEGDVLDAKRAKAEGMVDGIYTLEQAIARPRSERSTGSNNTATTFIGPDEGDEDEEADEAPDDGGDEEEQVAAREAGLKVLGRMRLRRLRNYAAAAAMEG